MLLFMVIGALLADAINRRTILLIAAVVFLVFAIPYFCLINTGSVLLATIAEVIGFGFVFGFGYGAIPAFSTENFPTRYRASGASAGYQISQVYGGGLIPIVAGLLLRTYGIHTAYLYIGLLVMVYAVLAILAIMATPETKGVSLEDHGHHDAIAGRATLGQVGASLATEHVGRSGELTSRSRGEPIQWPAAD